MSVKLILTTAIQSVMMCLTKPAKAMRKYPETVRVPWFLEIFFRRY